MSKQYAPHEPEEEVLSVEDAFRDAERSKGNQIALAAVERMAGMIPISDPELVRWLAESPEASIWETCLPGL